jgi:hypothetical protein
MGDNDTLAERESRAREWIRILSEMPARFAGTGGERVAAERIADWMRALGARDVALVPTPGAPRAGIVVGLHTGLGALGCYWGGVFGFLLAALAAWSFRSEYRLRRPILSRLPAAADSVNVVGRIGNPNPTRRVVISAHIDTAQAGWIFRREWADLFAGLANGARNPDQPPPGPLFLPEAFLIAAALIALGSWFGAHGFLFGSAKLGVISVLAINCVLTLQWAQSPPTPGANDNASAVAAMLTCGERLARDLPDDVELWMVGTGAEEVGCIGIEGFVEGHRDWPRDQTYFVNFECVGGGSLHYIRTEGLLHKQSFPPMMIDLARRVAASGAFGTVTPADLLANTDGHVPAHHDYPSLSMISLEANGVPRNYHRLEDTVDAIDMGTVVRAADFAAAVAAAALGGKGGPIVPRNHDDK